MLGYNSIKSQEACQNARDQQKSWILTILSYATTDELLVPYTEQSLKEKDI